MRIMMREYISGGRGDGEWPQPGVPFDVGDREGFELCRNGLAVPVPSEPGPPVEVRTETPPPGPDAGVATALPLPDPKAPKQDWVEHAVSKGADRDEASLMTKADLVDRYSPKVPE